MADSKLKSASEAVDTLALKKVIKISAENKKNPEEFLSPKIWTEQGDIFRLRDKTKQNKSLENAVYRLDIDPFGFYLEKMEEKFSFDHKIYGLEVRLIDRILKTYSATKGNLGILLNGVKGTGKTVTAKIACNKLDLPVILIPNAIDGCNIFLNSIPQDVIIFIDEFEKVFDKNSGSDDMMLTIMDGSLNSAHRRTFLLTTNNLYVNENLIQRPGRIRYLKTFGDLSPEIINEIVDDRLKHRKFKNDILKFVSNLEIITVDIVNSIIDEVNIHEESPESFKDIFNVKKISGKYNIIHIDEKTGTTIEEIKKGVSIYPREIDGNEGLVGNQFQIGNEPFGKIIEVLGRQVIKVQPDMDKKDKIAVRKLLDAIQNPANKRIKLLGAIQKDDNKETPANRKRMAAIKEIQAKRIKPMVLRIEDADTMNYKYKFGGKSLYDF